MSTNQEDRPLPVPSNVIDLNVLRTARSAKSIKTPSVPAARADVATGVLSGPWVEAFWFDVPFPVRSKSNYRHSRRPEARAQWETEKAFQAALANLAASAVPGGWDPGDGEVPLERRPAVVAVIGARTLLDAGNLSKSVLDALEDVTYVNDASVRACLTVAVRTGKGNRGVVALARLAPGASVTELVAATTELTTSLHALTSLDT